MVNKNVVDSQISTHKREAKLFFRLLLLYSLLPGIAKLIGIRSLFVSNVVIILFFLLSNLRKITVRKIDLPFIIFLLYIVAYIPISLILPTSCAQCVFVGIYSFFFPMLGYFVGKGISEDIIFDGILHVSFINALLGIFFYPSFLYPQFLQNIISPMIEGSAAFRMTSVSGSLGFSPLMLMGFNVALVKLLINNNNVKSRLLIFIIITICLILSMQRSAWLGAVISVVLIIYYHIIQLKIKRSFISSFVSITIGISLIAPILLSFLSSNIVDFLRSRIEDLFGAPGERSAMWVGAINNLLRIPTGTGLGQVGQVPRILKIEPYFNGVPDGDYFKIISENGFISILFFCFYFLCLAISIIEFRNKSNKFFTIVLLLTGFVIQMLGTNISEMYFVNFCFWLILGAYFKSLRILL